MANERKKEYPCLRCKKHVKKDIEAIQCGVCELWLHVHCPGADDPEVSKDLYKALVTQKTLTGNAYWVCGSCTKFAAKLDARVTALSKALDDVEKRVGTHDTEIEALKKDVAKLQQDAKDTNNKAKPDVVREKVTDAVFKELRERDAKRHNVVVHGLPEALRAVTDGKARREADIVKLQDMFAVLGVELDASRKVRTVTRLGTKGDDARPLLVSFRDSDDQVAVLDNASKLNRAADAVWKGVRILQDLTKIQRQEDKLLRQECDELAAKLSDEEAKNWRFRVVGRRGARRVAKVPNRTAVASVDAARSPRPTNARTSPARAERGATTSPAATTPPPAATPLVHDDEEEGPWTPVGRGGRHARQTPRGHPTTPQLVNQVTAAQAATDAGVERRTSARTKAMKETMSPSRGTVAPRGANSRMSKRGK